MVCIACFAYPLIVLVLMPMLEWCVGTGRKGLPPVDRSFSLASSLFASFLTFSRSCMYLYRLGKLVERWTGVKVAAEQPDDDETSTEANEEQAEAEMRDIDGSLGENEGREPEVVAASG